MVLTEDGMIRQIAKRLLRVLCGQYGIYRIYAWSANDARPSSLSNTFRFARVDADQVRASVDSDISEQSWYFGDHSAGYACLQGSRIVALCMFWYGERYRTARNFWPLKEGEAKLVQIVTLPEMRGRGIGSALIQYSQHDMMRRGFQCLYARVWHSNSPSRRAFENGGWKPIATAIEYHPFGLKKTSRIVVPVRTNPGRS